VTGIFSKKTDTKADGTSHSEERGWMRGDGAGTLNAVGDSHSEYRERHQLINKASSKNENKKLEAVDHLGIEEAPKK
jgi:hypothetical protein